MNVVMDQLFDAPIGALLIFGMRIIDVSMSMIRMILAVKGHRGYAACIGFFEVLVWLIAAGHALQHLNSAFHIVGYAAGFATGNYVGIWLEGRFALGVSSIRAVFKNTPLDSTGPAVAKKLREHGYAVTEMPGRGRESEVDILSIVVPRRNVPDVMRMLQEQDPSAFVTVEEVRHTHGGFVGPQEVAEGKGFIRPGGRKMPFLIRLN